LNPTQHFLELSTFSFFYDSPFDELFHGVPDRRINYHLGYQQQWQGEQKASVGREIVQQRDRNTMADSHSFFEGEKQQR